MPAWSTPGRPMVEDEQAIGEDADVAAAIAVHKWVQRALRRLAEETPGVTVHSQCGRVDPGSKLRTDDTPVGTSCHHSAG